MITELRLRNFKRFGNQPTRIPLAPLTLMLGSNSSGKSSILQALLIMRQAWENDLTGFAELRPQGRLVSLGRFGNVVHRHKKAPMEIGISWKDPFEKDVSADFTWEANFDENQGNIDEDKLPESGQLTACRLRSSQGTLLLGAAVRNVLNGNRRVEIPFLDGSWTGPRDPASALNAGRILGGASKTMAPRLVLDPEENIRRVETVGAASEDALVRAEQDAGRLPTQADADQFRNELIAARNAWQEAHGGLLTGGSSFMVALLQEIDATLFGARRKVSTIRYIGPTRVPGQRIYTRDGSTSDEVGARGERLGDVLARFPHRCVVMNRWLDTMGIPYQIRNRVLPTLDAPAEIRLESVRPGGATIGVPDVGFGVSQLLPILAEWVAMRERKTRSDTLIVEQPELHLHPDWQIALLRLLVEPLLREKEPHGPEELPEAVDQVILETHSELMVLAVQKLVRHGKLDPKRVSILAVEIDEAGVSQVRPIRMNDKGRFSDPWPNGFFPQRDSLLYGDRNR